MIRVALLICLAPLFLNDLLGQPTEGQKRMSSVENFDKKYSIIKDLKYENIGPTVFSGRVSDIAVDPADPTHFYVGYASGGLWETINNGTTFTPIFDREAVMTIGAIAVNWKTGTIWVGTGEVNSSRSSYAGVGVYKSGDNGKSWKYLGLEESHHIGRIILHPKNPEIAWIAVLGHLYSSNSERGVYMTKDGGSSWEHTLKIDEHTGVVDLLIDPSDSNILYASAWQRIRYAWDFGESGPGSGIYKSTNGGKSWKKMNGGNSGFPTGNGVGRIGLSVSQRQGKSILYALLDNYERRPDKEDDEEDEGLTKEDFKSMSNDDVAALEDDDLEEYLRSNRFPNKYKAKNVKKMITDGSVQPTDLATYLENANAMLFDTPVIGGELYSSTDGGKTWTRTHEGYLDGLYFSYGYYFGVIRVNPVNPDEVYIAGVPILRSDDGGKTFKNVNGDNVHVDHHVIWVNPDNPRHVINGNDGGINISYDNGDNWIKCNSPSVGQFYYINTDNAKPYNVYGGTQDNGVWMGANDYRSGVRWHNTGDYPYKSIMGGDGMQVQIDPRDNNTVYTGLQFGNYYRLDIGSGKRESITPRHELGQRPYRWNWQTPIHLSVHLPDILYMGGHKLFRSLDKGENFESISEDLTKGGKKGDVPYGTLSALHESPMRYGLLYTGSDDGLVHRSKDGGYSWDNISDQLPEDLWVSRVQASAHTESRVYIALNGYRSDDFTPYTYVSEDYGDSWTRLGLDLPMEPVNVIKEDPSNEDIIYIGTDRGVYISIDRGKSFMRTFKHIPNVPVHDLVVQSESKDLLIGTHGRSIYRADLESIYSIAKNQDASLLVMDLHSIRYNRNLGNRNSQFRDYTSNDQDIVIYSDSDASATLEVLTKTDSLKIFDKQLSLVKGLNYDTYDLSISGSEVDAYTATLKDSSKLKKAKNGKHYLLPGTYIVLIRKGQAEVATSLEIKQR